MPGAAGVPYKDKNFITPRKRTLLRVNHISWGRQHCLKALSFMDTEKKI